MVRQAMLNPFPGPAESNADARSERLTNQLDAIKQIFFRGLLRDVPVDRWLTLEDISKECAEAGVNAPPASVSAQLRHLRKPQHGSYLVQKRHLVNGLYEYNVSSAPPANQLPSQEDQHVSNATS